MLKKLTLIAAFCFVVSGYAQTTQITASNIAKFGGAVVTGQFCLTPTDGNGNALNLVTPAGQQFSPTVPLCFPIVSGVLSSTAIVPDTSQTQPINACYKLVVYDNANNAIGSYPCLQPQGASWSFDAYVPSTLPAIPALTLPQYELNGTALLLQSVVNFVCSGCTNPSAGTINIPAGSSLPSIATNTLLGNNSGSTAAAAQLSAAAVQSILGLGSAAYLASTAFDAANAGSTAQAASLQKSANLSDVASASAALANLGGSGFGANTYTGAQIAPAFYPQSNAAGPYVEFHDDFLTGANVASNPIGAPTGSACAVNTTYADVNHPGQILLTSGTAGTGTGITCGLQNETADVVSPNSSPGWTWETAVYVPVLPGTTGGHYQAGLVATPNVDPWTTGIGFTLSSADGTANNWYCRYTSTSINGGVAATVGWTRLTMVEDGAGVHWYVNGSQICSTGVANSSLASSTLYPANFSVVSTSATSLTMAVDYVAFQRNVTR